MHPGPDGHYETEFIESLVSNKDELSSVSFQAMAIPSVYDPTNGSVSKGDLLFTSSNLGDWGNLLIRSLYNNMKKVK
jgi:hypothetical protein